MARVGGYAAAALLLVSLSITPWVQLLFPLWVLLLSIEILRRSWTSTGTVGRDAGGG